MKAEVDPDRCMGHTMCHMLAGEVYQVTDAGFNEMGTFAVPPGAEAAARRGAAACPERAITLADEEA